MEFEVQGGRPVGLADRVGDEFGYGWHLIDRLTTHTHTELTPRGGKTICAHAPW
ncbi:hypothetical protein ACFYYM_37655 [Streptomyces erythrochromogenes]|uniref:hypothetical protein n=1 Tax=Streptomyces erythrochromogenes TaxID=285574 RepID=UPI0036C6B8F1